MKVIEGLYYSKEHEWVKVEGGKAYIGITDFATHSLGDIVYVELPELDAELQKDDVLGVVESVKAASDVYTPVSGVVVEVNEKLADQPELLNEDPYTNYIAVLKLTNEDELKDLMNSVEYQAFCENQ